MVRTGEALNSRRLFAAEARNYSAQSEVFLVYYNSAKAFIALCGQEKPGKFIDSAARRDECVTMWRIVFRVTIRAFPGPLLNMGEIAPSFFPMKPTGAKGG